MVREPPKEITYLLKKWKKSSDRLRAVHVSLATIAVVASLTVAAKIHSFQSDQIEWIALTAAVSTGLLGGLGLGTKSNNMRRAWRILNAAMMRYREEPEEQFSMEQLIKEYEKGEEIIGDVNAKT